MHILRNTKECWSIHRKLFRNLDRKAKICSFFMQLQKIKYTFFRCHKKAFWNRMNYQKLNEVETDLYFLQKNHNLTVDIFFWFMCFEQILNIKLFFLWFAELREQFQVRNLYKTLNSTKNWLSNFSKIEQNINPSHFLTAV